MTLILSEQEDQGMDRYSEQDYKKWSEYGEGKGFCGREFLERAVRLITLSPTRVDDAYRVGFDSIWDI